MIRVLNFAFSPVPWTGIANWVSCLADLRIDDDDQSIISNVNR